MLHRWYWGVVYGRVESHRRSALGQDNQDQSWSTATLLTKDIGNSKLQDKRLSIGGFSKDGTRDGMMLLLSFLCASMVGFKVVEGTRSACWIFG